MNINSRKGMEAGFLVALIITIASFMLIAGVVMRFMSSAEDKEAEILCHDSILLRAQSAVNIGGPLVDAEIKVIPSLCKTIDKKIKGDREEIMEQMAQKIARCWWMFGEGRFEEILHGQTINVLPSLLGVDNQPNKCFNCYNIMVDQDEIKEGPILYSEFIDYMWTHSPPNVNKSVNYLQYIQSYGGPGMFVNIVEGSIKPGHAYTVSILPKTKDDEQINWMKWVGFAAVGGTVVVGIACGYFSGGLCIPAALTAAAKVGGAFAATGLGYELVQGKYRPSPDIDAPGGVQDYGSGVSVKDMFKERQYTSIYISDAQYGQEFCGSGDIAGE